MNGRILSTDPEVDWQLLREANRRHDAQPHTVSMLRRANYRGGFSYPPDPKPKKRVRRYIDALGNIAHEVVDVKS